MAPLGLFEEVARLVLASEHELLLRLPPERVPRVADELVIAAARALPHVVSAVETDSVLSEPRRRELGDFFTSQLARIPEASSG